MTSPVQDQHRGDMSKNKIPYVKIEKVLFEIEALSPTDIKVYGLFKSHYNSVTGKCFPSLKTIAEKGRLSIPTVKRSRAKLMMLGLMLSNKPGKDKRSCSYEFPLVNGEEASLSRLLDTLKAMEKGSPMNLISGEIGVTHDPLKGSPMNPQGGHPRPPNKNKELKEITKDGLDLSPPLNGVDRSVHEEEEKIIVTQDEIEAVKAETPNIDISDFVAEKVVRARKARQNNIMST